MPFEDLFCSLTFLLEKRPLNLKNFGEDWSNPPASKANREGANLTWRKNPHPPVYGVKEFVSNFCQ